MCTTPERGNLRLRTVLKRGSSQTTTHSPKKKKFSGYAQFEKRGSQAMHGPGKKKGSQAVHNSRGRETSGCVRREGVEDLGLCRAPREGISGYAHSKEEDPRLCTALKRKGSQAVHNYNPRGRETSGCIQR